MLIECCFSHFFPKMAFRSHVELVIGVMLTSPACFLYGERRLCTVLESAVPFADRAWCILVTLQTVAVTPFKSSHPQEKSWTAPASGPRGDCARARPKRSQIPISARFCMEPSDCEGLYALALDHVKRSPYLGQFREC